MNILLTAIGSASALSVLRALQSNGHTVYGTDIYDMAWIYGANEFCNVYKVPLATSSEYVQILYKIAMQNNIDMIIPLTDIECDVLSNYKELFKNQNVTVACLDAQLNSLCRNKLLIQHKLCNIVKTIDTYSISEEREYKFPLMAKPVDGRSSQGIRILHSKQELTSLRQTSSNYIIQPFIDGSIYTVDCVRDKFNNCICLARKELLRTVNGLGIAVQFFDKQSIEHYAVDIMHNLNIIGCVNMEFIVNDKNTYFLEINPRFSGGVGFSIMHAYDFANANVTSYTNMPISTMLAYKAAILKQGYEKQL